MMIIGWRVCWGPFLEIIEANVIWWRDTNTVWLIISLSLSLPLPLSLSLSLSECAHITLRCDLNTRVAQRGDGVSFLESMAFTNKKNKITSSTSNCPEARTKHSLQPWTPFGGPHNKITTRTNHTLCTHNTQSMVPQEWPLCVPVYPLLLIKLTANEESIPEADCRRHVV